MCKQITILAVNNDCRQVWRCEHGTVHLNWDQVTVRLRPEEFRRVVRLLEEGVARLDSSRISKGDACSLVVQENGFYQLWCGNIVLLLETAGFFHLVELARAAERQLNIFMRLGQRPGLIPETCARKLAASSGSKFSLN